MGHQISNKDVRNAIRVANDQIRGVAGELDEPTIAGNRGIVGIAIRGGSIISQADELARASRQILDEDVANVSISIVHDQIRCTALESDDMSIFRKRDAAVSPPTAAASITAAVAVAAPAGIR